MEWYDVPEVVDDWATRAEPLAADLRPCAAQLFTHRPVGYYYHPGVDKVALYRTPAPGLRAGADAAEIRELNLCKAAAAHAVGATRVRGLFLSYPELAEPYTQWVKVAYSPLLRRTGELLNFFPGQYPGGLPNAPSPLAAMLTAGLLGAGLGWGGGRLLNRLLPEHYGDNLGRTGAVLGGLAGAAPGAVWGLTNHAAGRGLLDPRPLNHPAGAPPLPDGATLDGSNRAAPPPAPPEVADGLGAYLQRLQPRGLSKRGLDLWEELATVPLADCHHAAVRAFLKEAGDAFGSARRPDPTPLDVNIDHLGRTLWSAGASPALAATTMSALYAGQQMPDQRSRPGWVTGHQLGQLAQNAVGDYARGLLVGAAINAAVGTPWRASTFGVGGVALGVLGAVVPRLFGD